MIFRASKYLGLAIGERSILAAEVAADRKVVTHMAEFPIPAGLSLDKPAELGDALRRFLRQQHFSASHAVIGVPARWLMAMQREVPPASPEVAASALRLQAERMSPELKELVFDYAGNADPTTPRRVLMVAMQRQHLNNLTQMADAAGLSAVAVCPSVLALSAFGRAANTSGLSLALNDDCAELAALGQPNPRLLKYIPFAVASAQLAGNGHVAAAVSDLGGQLQQMMALMPPEAGNSSNSANPQQLMIWDGVGLEDDHLTSLGQRLRLPVRRANGLADLGVTHAGANRADEARFATPVALALAGSRRELLGLDFVHSRLAPPKKRRISRQAAMGIAVAALVVFGLGYTLWDIRQRQAELDDLTKLVASEKPAVDKAKVQHDKVELARNWYDRRTPVLGCLMEVTKAFPNEGSIWVTSFSMRDTRKATASGKAVNQRTFTSVLDELKKNPKFSEVDYGHVGDATGNTRDAAARETSFQLIFTYIGME